MINKALYTSNSDEWYTPQELFDSLNKEFNFDMDAATSDDHHLCPIYYTKETDGLKQEWGGHCVFCNPPYSNISAWVEKAFRETRKDHTVVVMLIPSRTDTRYFHDYIYKRSEIRFVKGRLNFSGKDRAPFPSMLVIWRGAKA